MSISEQARELATKGRQKVEKIQDNLLERSEEQLEKGSAEKIGEKSRELLAETRQHLEQTKENILERTKEKIQE